MPRSVPIATALLLARGVLTCAVATMRGPGSIRGDEPMRSGDGGGVGGGG